MWVFKGRFLLNDGERVFANLNWKPAVFFQLVWAIVVWGCSCLLRTDGGLWNQYILVSQCVRLWGSASLWFFSLQRSCKYPHMARADDSFLQTRALSFFLSCLGNVQLFVPNNSILGWPRDENLLCMCAFVCESHYHNLQPIKSLRNAALMVLITTCSLGYWGEKKKPTRSNKESPYGTTGAKKVGWESGEAFHLVSFVWVKISNENKQRKGISIILQKPASLEASTEKRKR